MHVLIAIFVVCIIWYNGCWRDWQRYHTTMLFFGSMELQYNLIVGAKDYFLWRMIPDFNLSSVYVSCLYAFIIFPGTVLLLLSKFPQGLKNQILHVSKYVLIYTAVEWLAGLMKRIDYFNGWSLYHSFIFNMIFFTGMLLHHKKPVAAYIVFIFIMNLGIWIFKIPL